MKSERLPTLFGENRPSASSPLLTREGAKRLGARLMPADLRAAGFTVDVFTASHELNGWRGYRVGYGKRVAR